MTIASEVDQLPPRPALDLSGIPSDVPTSAPARDRTRARHPVSVALLLIGTAVAYLWNLTSSGYANSFYAAAVEAGTKSWKAFFFGSIDSSSFITVDKPPASLWVMELSGRLFGFSSASMLVPQVLEGVATVALVYAVVRRWFGHRCGLLAGVVMATTPVAALMFRFNNPDALLVLLLTAAAYAVTRAIEKASTPWLVLAGAAIGAGFLAKMGQALLVVPGFGLAYLVAAPGPLRHRLFRLVAGAAAMVMAAAWWVVIVMLWPVGSRPMIDGSPNNSIWNLIVGYNGVERVLSSGTGGGAAGGFSGSTGWLRLFNSLMGGQASWLLPAAVVALVGGLIVTARRPRRDRTRAALLLWGGWLVVTAAVFSFGQGIIHTYYTVALAPAIAVLVAIGVALLAQCWHQRWAGWVAVATLMLTAWWSASLLSRSSGWEPWLRPAVVAIAALGVVAIVLARSTGSTTVRRWATGAALVAAVFAGLAGPTAYALETIGTAHTGSVPSAGPTVTASISSGPAGGGPGAGGGAGPGGRPSGGLGRGAVGGTGAASGSRGLAGSSARGATPSELGSGAAVPGSSGRSPGARLGVAASRGVGATATGGGPTGSGGGAQVSSALVSALERHAARYRWVAATEGSQSAASLELATDGDPVMAIGGFNGQGGHLSLARFESYVAQGDIHYFVVSGGGAGGPGAGPGGGSSTAAIVSWVEHHFTAETVGGATVYDLTASKG